MAMYQAYNHVENCGSDQSDGILACDQEGTLTCEMTKVCKEYHGHGSDLDHK